MKKINLDQLSLSELVQEASDLEPKKNFANLSKIQLQEYLVQNYPQFYSLETTKQRPIRNTVFQGQYEFPEEKSDEEDYEYTPEEGEEEEDDEEEEEEEEEE